MNATLNASGTTISSTPASVSAVTASSGGDRASPGSTDVDHHVLDDGVVLERVLASVLAPARLLHPAVRRLGRQGEVLIDPDVPELERLGDAHRAPDVGREDRGREAIRRVVRPGDRLLLVAEALDRDHRAEDLVLNDLGLLVRPGDDGRLVVVAGAIRGRATDHHLGPASSAIDH